MSAVRDLLLLAAGTVRAQRLRSALSILGIAIGVAAVVLLTSIGEGTRRYVVEQFSQFGTNLISVNPGRTETAGIPGIFGGTTDPLTLDDALSLTRVPGVARVVPLAIGTAPVEGGPDGRVRAVPIYGVTPDVPEVWRFRVRQGAFWPAGDPRRALPACVLGQRLARELYGGASPLGELVRIAGARFRVVGLMEPKGSLLGIDIDDVAYVPVASALQLFNQAELHEIHVAYAHPGLAAEVEAGVRAALTARHGDEDFTLTTQQAMLDVFGNVLGILTLAVGAIGGISLLVGAIGVLTMMWIAVGERTSEIGLVRACGATRHQVRVLFLAEAGMLGFAGGAAGLAGGLSLCALLRALLPGLPVATPPLYAAAALGVSLLTGLVAGSAPAARAAALDPIEALRAE